MLVDQQNANILPGGELIECLLDLGYFGLCVDDEEVLGAARGCSDVPDSRKE